MQFGRIDNDLQPLKIISEKVDSVYVIKSIDRYSKKEMIA